MDNFRRRSRIRAQIFDFPNPKPGFRENFSEIFEKFFQNLKPPKNSKKIPLGVIRCADHESDIHFKNFIGLGLIFANFLTFFAKFFGFFRPVKIIKSLSKNLKTFPQILHLWVSI